MTQRLRLPPYGPRIAAIGAGAVLQAATAAVSEEQSNYTVPEELTELATQAGLTDLRASLSLVKSTSTLRARVEMEAVADAISLDGDLNVSLQITRDPTLPVGDWVTVGTSAIDVLSNVRLVGEPSTYNVMRHTIRFEADVLADAVQSADLGSTFTARALVGTELTGVAISMLVGSATVTVEELVPAGEAGAEDDLRLPSAGPYRALRSTGSVIQESVGRFAPLGEAVIPALESDLLPNVELTPIKRDSSLRLITQLIVITLEEGWTTPGTVTVSLQLSDDAGGSWVEVGVLDAVIEPSLQSSGPDVANNIRNLLAYQADALILEAFPAYAGTEIVARAMISADVAFSAIFGEGGTVGSSWLKLQEIRA
jgi:hypothetical protein